MAQECEKLETCGLVKSKIWRAEVSLISIARETKWTNAKERNIAENMARLPQMT